ncbi:MAG TPA: PaaI family thioesterase [Thermoanaerobaculia bacterium]|nr:PaaI family thioesterase [Thermoanaerobaculia bacterium]
MRVLGAELALVQAGRVEVVLRSRPDLTQQAGLLHAGVIAAIADSSCGYAALTLMPAGSDVVSVEFKLSLLAPARGVRVVARGEVVRAGRTLTVCRADVFGEDETIVATMLGTMMRRADSSGTSSAISLLNKPY